jgi:hypothetical protein
MTMLMVGLLVVCSLVALANWRHGIFLSVIVDALRDPIRKLTPDQPVWMSQGIVLVWAVILFSCLTRNGRTFRDIRVMFPRLRDGAIFFITALIPGAILSFILYQNGWFLVLIGGMSYVGPLLGLYVGICFAENTRDIVRLMQMYVVINSVVLVGSLAEQLGWDWPGLGGLLGMVWIRHMPGVLVRMVSGFYRSPDIAGLHAAHVVVFSILLAIPKSRRDMLRPHWFVSAIWGIFTLFVAGRRKMFAIPVVFLLVWVYFEFSRRQRSSKNLLAFISLAVVVVGGGMIYFVQGDEQLEHHQVYMSTTIFEMAPKFYDNSLMSSVVTVSQSGILGSGLGVATQGAQYAGVERTQVWQEDGLSRLFKELGVPGVFLLIVAAVQFFRSLRQAFKIPLQDPARVLLQNAGISIFLANLACFVVSHQHISGDVTNGIMPLLFLGSVFGHVIGNERRLSSIPTLVNGANASPSSMLLLLPRATREKNS